MGLSPETPVKMHPDTHLLSALTFGSDAGLDKIISFSIALSYLFTLAHHKGAAESQD